MRAYKGLHAEYLWTIPSGDPILISGCDHGEPVLCSQSVQNSLETHPKCLTGMSQSKTAVPHVKHYIRCSAGLGVGLSIFSFVHQWHA